MDLVQYLMEGHRPAALAGFALVLIAAFVALQRKEVSVPALVAMALGGILCGLPFIASAKVGKDGFELVTATADVAKTLGEDLKTFRNETSVSLKNVNNQVAELGIAQQKLAETVAKLAAAPASSAQAESAAALKAEIDRTNRRLIEVFGQTDNLANSIGKADAGLSGAIERLDSVQKRLLRD